MPELPEVETTRQGILPHIKDQTVTVVQIRQSKLRWPITENMVQLISGKKLNNVGRRGKYLILEFDHGSAFIHLGMSGSIRILGVDAVVDKHDHFDICFSNGKLLRYNDPRRFGAFLWAGEIPFEHKLLAKLGVEPLGNEFDADMLFKASRNRKVAIKQFIMNSHIVVGIGNIYANEALFQAGIHPSRQACRISLKRYQRLVDVIKKVLNEAIEQGGTTLKDFNQVDGKPGYFAQSLNVYGRAGQACLQCTRRLAEIRQSGRTTVFCMHCQT
ncbi:MAG: bifunctional DNA-formamidopyrimidine glycosylase/DNA-(apurinic or apyrimidinic site) lyase [Gammaproteobacteria bacterium]|nr:bifunctional DNA-formamidopyrimidine glycosylase/DNA-(apurinic or apyrimidinic site) lyase [Gammaproteobacteria bacterium]